MLGIITVGTSSTVCPVLYIVFDKESVCCLEGINADNDVPCVNMALPDDL